MKEGRPATEPLHFKTSLTQPANTRLPPGSTTTTYPLTVPARYFRKERSIFTLPGRSFPTGRFRPPFRFRILTEPLSTLPTPLSCPSTEHGSALHGTPSSQRIHLESGDLRWPWTDRISPAVNSSYTEAMESSLPLPATNRNRFLFLRTGERTSRATPLLGKRKGQPR